MRMLSGMERVDNGMMTREYYKSNTKPSFQSSRNEC